MPVALESVASILMAGKATFTMSYEYHSVNGVEVSPDRSSDAGGQQRVRNPPRPLAYNPRP